MRSRNIEGSEEHADANTEGGVTAVCGGLHSPNSKSSQIFKV